MARYYWIKIHDNFFERMEIKKLRKMPGGDTLTIIYLKLLILTRNSDGKIKFEGIESSLSKELALQINEEEASIELTLHALKMMKLLEEYEGDIALTEHSKVTGANPLEIEKKALGKPEDPTHKYGVYQHVKLKDSQYKGLIEYFGSKEEAEKRIGKLDEGIEIKGYKYKNHSLAIKNWAEKDGFVPRGAPKKEKRAYTDFSE